jgi:hypothetical protein
MSNNYDIGNVLQGQKLEFATDLTKPSQDYGSMLSDLKPITNLKPVTNLKPLTEYCEVVAEPSLYDDLVWVSKKTCRLCKKVSNKVLKVVNHPKSLIKVLNVSK